VRKVHIYMTQAESTKMLYKQLVGVVTRLGSKMYECTWTHDLHFNYKMKVSLSY